MHTVRRFLISSSLSVSSRCWSGLSESRSHLRSRSPPYREHRHCPRRGRQSLQALPEAVALPVVPISTAGKLLLVACPEVSAEMQNAWHLPPRLAAALKQAK